MDLRFSTDAVIKLEEFLGMGIFEFMGKPNAQMEILSVRVLRGFVWAGSLHKTPSLTLEETELKLKELPKVAEQVMGQLMKDLGLQEEAAEEGEKKPLAGEKSEDQPTTTE